MRSIALVTLLLLATPAEARHCPRGYIWRVHANICVPKKGHGAEPIRAALPVSPKVAQIALPKVTPRVTEKVVTTPATTPIAATRSATPRPEDDFPNPPWPWDWKRAVYKPQWKL